jgi:DNA-3-methyladenine glycosylase II
MFLMFSLRRPDVLPVGDLGVQKGLLRWALAAHGALPKSKSGKAAEEARKKYGLGKKDAIKDEVDSAGNGEIDTVVVNRPTTPKKDSARLPPTPLTPGNASSSTTHLAVLHTPAASNTAPTVPPTPMTPGPSTAVPNHAKKELKPEEAFEANPKALPPPAPETFLDPMTDHPHWDAKKVASLEDGMTVELMKSRLAGKKAKGGAYLTPAEMDVLTQGWRPYRSLAVYYMWPAGEEF